MAARRGLLRCGARLSKLYSTSTSPSSNVSSSASSDVEVRVQVVLLQKLLRGPPDIRTFLPVLVAEILNLGLTVRTPVSNDDPSANILASRVRVDMNRVEIKSSFPSSLLTSTILSSLVCLWPGISDILYGLICPFNLFLPSLRNPVFKDGSGTKTVLIKLPQFGRGQPPPLLFLYTKLQCLETLSTIETWRRVLVKESTASLELVESMNELERLLMLQSPTGAGVEVQDFLRAIGKGVEAHAEKMAKEAGSLPNFLRFRGGSLKGLGIPCQQRKLILRYIEKYRQGTWKPYMT